MEWNIIGNISFYDMTFYFFIYGFLGWCVEVIFASLKTGKFINRGFLNGPTCPIYGIGMAFCVLFLNTVAEHWLLLFVVGCLFSSLLELITGFLLEKIFKTKWWDYSQEPFNFKGYICLKFSLLWGIGILLTFKTLVPVTDAIIGIIPFRYLGAIILLIFWLAFIVDLISTGAQLKGLTQSLKELIVLGEKLKDGSNIIGEKISEATLVVNEKLNGISNRVKKSRLGKAFPYMLKKGEDVIDKIKEKLDNVIKK